MATQLWQFQPLGAVRPHGRPDLSVILPDLLVGEYPHPDDVAWLHATHGVTSVLCLQDDADLASKAIRLGDLAMAYQRVGVGFDHLPVPDCDLDTFAVRIDAIVVRLHELLGAGERVYVHCNAGMNRAPTVAVAYLHCHRGLSLDAARDWVKQRRACVPYMTLLESRYQASR